MTNEREVAWQTHVRKHGGSAVSFGGGWDAGYAAGLTEVEEALRLALAGHTIQHGCRGTCECPEVEPIRALLPEHSP